MLPRATHRPFASLISSAAASSADSSCIKWLYRDLGVEHQIAMTLTPPGTRVIGIALNRTSADFTDEDADALNLHHTRRTPPPIAKADPSFHQFGESSHHSMRSPHGQAVALVDNDGNVVRATAAAERGCCKPLWRFGTPAVNPHAPRGSGAGPVILARRKASSSFTIKDVCSALSCHNTIPTNCGRLSFTRQATAISVLQDWRSGFRRARARCFTMPQLRCPNGRNRASASGQSTHG